MPSSTCSASMRGLVALTKAISLTRRAEVRAEIAAACGHRSCRLRKSSPVSAVTAEGIDTLRARLFDAAREIGASDTRRPLPARGRSLLHLERRRTVVTGTVLSGAVSVGDHVVDQPVGIAGARALDPRAKSAGRAWAAGERCALNLAGDGVAKDADPSRRYGARSVAPRADRPHRRTATFAGFGDEVDRDGCRCGCITRRLKWRARIVPLEDAPIAPGGQAMSSSCWIGRSRRRPATGSSCATLRRNALSAVALSRPARAGAQAARAGSPGAASAPTLSAISSTRSRHCFNAHRLLSISRVRPRPRACRRRSRAAGGKARADAHRVAAHGVLRCYPIAGLR